MRPSLCPILPLYRQVPGQAAGARSAGHPLPCLARGDKSPDRKNNSGRSAKRNYCRKNDYLSLARLHGVAPHTFCRRVRLVGARRIPGIALVVAGPEPQAIFIESDLGVLRRRRAEAAKRFALEEAVRP